MKYEYITKSLVQNTDYKSIKTAYQNDCFSVVKYGSCFWLESRGCPNRTHNLIVKEMKRIYPNMTYII